MNNQRTLAWMVVASMAIGACGVGPGTGPCVAGATRACACTDGRMGNQSCLPSGEGYGSCTCTGSTADVTPPDNIPGPDVQPDVQPTDPCVGNRDCASCTAGATCGWCNGRCYSGNVNGPNGAICSDTWRWVPSSCPTAPTCTRQPGQSCTTATDCCPSNGVASLCVTFPGYGSLCASSCRVNSDCGGNCCTGLMSGGNACAPPLYCRSTASCTRAIGQSCASDDSCCPDPSGVRSVCSGNTTTGYICRAVCNQNSDCASGCCALRSDGIRICSAASACG